MSKSAIIFLVIYVFGSILAFIKDPFYGLITYVIEYYNHPPLKWWGKELPDLRWSLTISFITLIAYFIGGKKQHQSVFFAPPQTKWLVLFMCTILIVTPFAVDIKVSWEYAITFMKLLVLYFLILKLIRTKKQYHIFIWTHILCSFLWGWDAYRNPRRVAGRLVNIGGPDSIGDNAVAAHMLTVIPFLGYYFLAGKKWEKILSVLVAPFILNTIILANSRGTTVAMGIAAVAALLLSKSSMRPKIILGMILASILFIKLTDNTFWERQKTIRNYEQDGSAKGRLESWKGSLKLMRDYPFGAGGGGGDILSPIYIPKIVAAHGGELRTVHNTYLLAGSDWGFLGLFFFCAFLGSTGIVLHRIRLSPPRDEDKSRLHIESLAIEIALIGLLTAAFFINRLYAEAIYWLCGIAAALQNIYNREPDLDSESITEKDNILDNTIIEFLVRLKLWKAKRKFHKQDSNH